jgi:hypothetical protein
MSVGSGPRSYLSAWLVTASLRLQANMQALVWDSGYPWLYNGHRPQYWEKYPFYVSKSQEDTAQLGE